MACLPHPEASSAPLSGVSPILKDTNAVISLLQLLNTMQICVGNHGEQILGFEGMEEQRISQPTK
jgi:hypothetical protein